MLKSASNLTLTLASLATLFCTALPVRINVADVKSSLTFNSAVKPAGTPSMMLIPRSLAYAIRSSPLSEPLSSDQNFSSPGNVKTMPSPAILPSFASASTKLVSAGGAVVSTVTTYGSDESPSTPSLLAVATMVNSPD